MLQGARHEHMHALLKAAASLDLEIEIRELRKSSDITGIDALVLPGGESTAMKIASQSEDLYSGLWNSLKQENIPVLGTCAGAILLSQQKLVKTNIERNAFGRQRDSFQAQIKINIEEESEYPGVFIRAPRFTGECINPIAWLGDEVVGVLEGNRMALTFHPELTDDLRFHMWLLDSASHKK
jgi:5'-phosphate synthase pdxT subunit|tara:strand:- start:58 stop:603 length:546 start_codon:yes stop_codon:yes gene_type:complete